MKSLSEAQPKVIHSVPRTRFGQSIFQHGEVLRSTVSDDGDARLSLSAIRIIFCYLGCNVECRIWILNIELSVSALQRYICSGRLYEMRNTGIIMKILSRAKPASPSCAAAGSLTSLLDQGCQPHLFAYVQYSSRSSGPALKACRRLS